MKSATACSAYGRSKSEEQQSQLIRQVIREGYFRDRHDRRLHIRYPLQVTVRVQPLDEDGETVGDEIEGVTRNLSSGGAYLYTREPFEAAKARLTLESSTGEKGDVVLSVSRRGQVGPLYYFAGEFKLKVARSKQHWMELVGAS